MLTKYSQLRTATEDELLNFIDNADRTGYHPVPKDAVQELNNRSNQELVDKTLRIAKITLVVSFLATVVSVVSCGLSVLQWLASLK